MKIKKKDINLFIESNSGKHLLKEISNLVGHSGIEGDNDDKICGFYKNKETFLSLAEPRARQIGYTILNDLIGKADSAIHTNPVNYSGDFTDDISYYLNSYRTVEPATYYDKNGEYKSGNRRDINYNGDVAYNKWKNHIQKVAALVGWSFVDWKETKNEISLNESFKLKQIYNKILSEKIYNNILQIIERKDNDNLDWVDQNIYNNYINKNINKSSIKYNKNDILPDIKLNTLKNGTITEVIISIRQWYENIIKKFQDRKLRKQNLQLLKDKIQNVVNIITARPDYNGRSDLQDALDYISDFNESYNLNININ